MSTKTTSTPEETHDLIAGVKATRNKRRIIKEE